MGVRDARGGVGGLRVVYLALRTPGRWTTIAACSWAASRWKPSPAACAPPKPRTPPPHPVNRHGGGLKMSTRSKL
eukprot:scaffold5274_cov79-Isochrysis_galbana.AAC.1